jgi:AraC-like DNA-binding protein
VIEIPTADTTVDGSRTRRWVLDSQACPLLAAQRIARLGIDTTHAPYERVRLRPSGSFFLASLEGEGRILLEGRWSRLGPGEVIMAPPRVLNAFFTPPGGHWTFAWMRYEEASEMKPLVGAVSPLRVTAGAAELARVIAGLRDEWESEREATVVHHWISLADAHARRLARPWRGHEKLWRLWEDVAGRLAEPWTLDGLAQRVHMSAEHLRRTCRREIGRSPMEHLTYIRMQRAQELLETTDDKLETVAALVGYSSGLVFSRAFARCIGLSPSEYRQRR